MNSRKTVDKSKKEQAIMICERLEENGHIHQLNPKYEGMGFIRIFCTDDTAEVIANQFALLGFDAIALDRWVVEVDITVEVPVLSIIECFNNI